MSLQAMVDALGESMRNTRSDYHLTLGAAIRELSMMPKPYMVAFDFNNFSPGEEMSYRGYYSDLAFDPESDEPKTVEAFLHQLKAALDREYMGYKGGDFLMGGETPLWVSGYGTTSGRAIVGIHQDIEKIVLLTKETD